MSDCALPKNSSGTHVRAQSTRYSQDDAADPGLHRRLPVTFLTSHLSVGLRFQWCCERRIEGRRREAVQSFTVVVVTCLLGLPLNILPSLL